MMKKGIIRISNVSADFVWKLHSYCLLWVNRPTPQIWYLMCTTKNFEENELPKLLYSAW